MATRFWLTSSAAPYNPATKRGAWDLNTSATVGLLGRSTGGTAATVVGTSTVTTAAWDVLLGRWISAPAVKAGTLSGTVAWVLGLVESNAAHNAFVHVHIYVTAGDTATVRGTLLTDHIGTTEFGTTAAGVASNGSPAITSTAIQVGDRIVVEVGYRASATATGYTATLNYGGTGTTDLAAAATTVTTTPGWVDFSGLDSYFATPVSAIVDKFTTGIGTQFVFYSGTFWNPTYNRVALPPNSAYAGLLATDVGYEMAGSSFHAEICNVPVGGTASEFSAIILGPVDDGTMLCFRYVPATGNLTLENRVDYFDGAPTTLTYDPVAHRWWRFREAAGTLYWETSPNAATWTVRRSLATPQWVKFGTLRANFEAYASGGTPTVAEVDNVNAVPTAVPKVWSGSAWVQKPLKVWSGSTWVAKPVKSWSSTTWF